MIDMQRTSDEKRARVLNLIAKGATPAQAAAAEGISVATVDRIKREAREHDKAMCEYDNGSVLP